MGWKEKEWKKNKRRKDAPEDSPSAFQCTSTHELRIGSVLANLPKTPKANDISMLGTELRW